MLAQLPQGRKNRVASGNQGAVTNPIAGYCVRKFTEFKELLRDDDIGHAHRCLGDVEHTFDDIIDNREWK